MTGTAENMLVSSQALRRMRAYIDASTSPITWFGMVRQKNGRLVVTEILLPRQYADQITVEVTPDYVYELANALVESGNLESLNSIRFWGISHHKFDIDPSAVEHRTAEQLARNSSDYFVRANFNKQGECDIALYRPEQSLANVVLSVLDEDSGTVSSAALFDDQFAPTEEMLAEARSEIATKVSPFPTRQLTGVQLS